jgi:hypothetical protein
LLRAAGVTGAGVGTITGSALAVAGITLVSDSRRRMSGANPDELSIGVTSAVWLMALRPR